MRRLIISALTVIMIIGSLFAAPITSQAVGDSSTGFETGKVYFIRNARSGKYLESYNGGITDGTRAQQYTYGEAERQQWAIESDGTSYRIIAINTLSTTSPPKALSVTNNQTVNNSPIAIWEKGTYNSSWNIVKNTNRTDRSYRFIETVSGKALAVEGASYNDNANVILYDYSDNATTNDEWIFEPVMDVEIYYDEQYVTKVGNKSDSEIQTKLKGYFATVSDAFYQKYGTRFTTPTVIRNTTSEGTDSTNTRDLMFNALQTNLPERIYKIQYTGRDIAVGGAAGVGHPVLISTYAFNEQLSGGANNEILLAHEMTHNFGLAHHDGQGSDPNTYCVMSMQGMNNAYGLSIKPNWWCADCRAVIQRDAARYSTWTDWYGNLVCGFEISETNSYIYLSDVATVHRLNYIELGFSHATLADKTTILGEYDKVGTGMWVNYTMDGPPQSGIMCEAVTKGDVNGDGDVTALDFLKVRQYMLDPSVLQGAYLKAGDVNRSGSVDSVDALLIQRYMTTGQW